MPSQTSEQTPLLQAALPANPRTYLAIPRIHLANPRKYLAKTWKYFIKTVDIVIIIPLLPIKLLLDWADRKLRGPWQEHGHVELSAIIGFWIHFTVVFSVLTAIVGVLRPFFFCDLIFLASILWVRLLDILYKIRISRFIIRSLAVATILLTAWYVIDIRHAFTSADLPPLDSSGSSIRILDLHPAGQLWGIKAELRTVRLEDNPAFDALSYQWGNPRKSHSITVGGKRLRVTANLWDALHSIRHETETRALWVDAISIDQENLDEKSRQIPLMSLIYRRARSVLVSLGKHIPPRWIDQSDPTMWTASYIETMTEAYWDSTGYWLEQLMLEEYWKRCWVVQEMGSAFNIEVYYTYKKVIPWDKLAALMKVYASKNPTSKLVERVLRFDTLRRELYHDGRTYVLGQLLEAFRDSFCSVNLDKIYAFAGMAIDCQGECLPVDYAGGPTQLYQELMYYQRSIADQNMDVSIEMLHFSALVRRLLSRKQDKIERVYQRPSLLYQPESWVYYFCGDDSGSLCTSVPDMLLLTLPIDVMRAPFSPQMSFRFESSVWIPDTAEVKSAWSPQVGDGMRIIQAVGAIVGRVRELGPTYASYLRDPRVPNQWSTRLSQVYVVEEEIRRARGLNARLSALLGPAADYRLADVINLQDPEQDTPGPGGPRLFLGADDIIMGLAPSNAQVGDMLCQFWNSSAVAILRNRNNSDQYDIVGRGAMLQHGEAIDWDIPTEKTMFLPTSPARVELDLDLNTLNHLSFDTISL